VSEEKKGHVKVTMDLVNEPLLDLLKEMMSKLPEMMAQAMKKREGAGAGSFIGPVRLGPADPSPAYKI
jgi:hypothetical protein